MYGFTMIKDYLNEILNGSKTFGACSYTTNKRGTIALVDSRSMMAYGHVDLVGVRKIPHKDMLHAILQVDGVDMLCKLIHL